MKAFKLFSMALVMILIVSCNNHKSSSTTSTNDPSEPYNGNEVSKRTSENVDKRSNDIYNEDESETNDMDRDMKSTQNYTLYSDLNMTQEQISLFEKKHNEYMSEMRIKNGGNQINKDSLQMHKDKTLKSILNPDQYKKYEQWKINNPVDDKY